MQRSQFQLYIFLTFLFVCMYNVCLICVNNNLGFNSFIRGNTRVIVIAFIIFFIRGISGITTVFMFT